MRISVEFNEDRQLPALKRSSTIAGGFFKEHREGIKHASERERDVVCMTERGRESVCMRDR